MSQEVMVLAYSSLEKMAVMAHLVLVSLKAVFLLLVTLDGLI